MFTLGHINTALKGALVILSIYRIIYKDIILFAALEWRNKHPNNNEG